MNNAGFLSIESVRENQLANLSKQIDNLKEENDRLEDINEELMEERNRLNNIINGITKVIKHDYFKAREFKEKIQRSELCQGDYPIAYYHADWLEDTTDEYLNKLQELKGDDKE